MAITKTVVADGETVDWSPNVKHNGSGVDCKNAKLTFNIPSGVRLIGPTDEGSTKINVPQGYYSITDKVWYIGDLSDGKSIPSIFDFIVDDIALADPNDNSFIVTATLTTSCAESNTSNNTDVFKIEVVDPCTQISLSIGSGSSESQSVDLSIG